MTEEQLAATLLGIIIGFLLFLVLLAIATIAWYLLMAIIGLICSGVEWLLRSHKANRISKQYVAEGKIWADKAEYARHLKAKQHLSGGKHWYSNADYIMTIQRKKL